MNRWWCKQINVISLISQPRDSSAATLPANPPGQLFTVNGVAIAFGVTSAKRTAQSHFRIGFVAAVVSVGRHGCTGIGLQGEHVIFRNGCLLNRCRTDNS